MKKSQLVNVAILLILKFSTATMAVELTISNINRPATDYIVQYNDLDVGREIYTDRSYTFTDVGSLGGFNPGPY